MENKYGLVRDLLIKAAAEYGDREALVWLEGDEVKSINYGTLLNKVKSLYHNLYIRGWKDKHIGILAPNSEKWVILYFTVLSGLGVAVPIGVTENAESVAYMCGNGDISAAFCQNTFLPMIPEGIDALDIAELDSFCNDAVADFDDAAPEADKMCKILYTSGTTGQKRGVMLTMNNIMSIASSYYGKYNGSRTLCSLPFSHGYEAVCHLLSALNAGSTICIGRSALRFVQDIKTFNPESVYLVPAQADALLRSFSRVLDSTPSLKTVVCGGATIRQGLITDFAEKGIKLLGGYGLSECSPLVSLNEDATPDSVGKEAPYCEVRIANPDEHGTGEIQVKGDNVMLGYYRNEKDTAATFTDDGWLKTGDVGRKDENGNLYISGRIKNLIVLPNGENIIPEELEQQLAAALPGGSEPIVSDEHGTLTATLYTDEEQAEGLSQLLKKAVEQFNKTVPPFMRILAQTVSTETPDRTSLGKIKRSNWGRPAEDSPEREAEKAAEAAEKAERAAKVAREKAQKAFERAVEDAEKAAENARKAAEKAADLADKADMSAKRAAEMAAELKALLADDE